MKRLLIATALLFVPTAACSDLDDYEPHSGDIIFQVSRSHQSRAIQIVTGRRIRQPASGHGVRELSCRPRYASAASCSAWNRWISSS